MLAPTEVRRSKLLLCAALVAAAVAAGCGGSDGDEDYADKLETAQKTFERELSAAGAKMRAAGQARSRQQYGQGARQLQSAVTEFNGTLEDLEAPEDAEDEEKAVIAALKPFSATVGRINDAVQANDRAGVQSENATLQSQARAVDNSIADLINAAK